MHALGMGIPYHSRRNPDFLYPLRYVPFEGHLLPVPNKSDELLRDIYGDYMQLPPVEQRVEKHHRAYLNMDRKEEKEEVLKKI